MKVLLIAPTSDSIKSVRDAFLVEGHVVTWIDERASRLLPPSLRHRPWAWRIVRHVPFLRNVSNALLGKHIVKTAKRLMPDLVLMCKGDTIQSSALKELRRMDIPLANWFPENGNREPYRSWLEQNIGLYDIFFAFDSALLARQAEFPHTRLIYLPLGVGPDGFHVDTLTTDDHARYDADICFVGAWYPEREQILSALTQYNIKIFGWKGWERSTLKDFYHGPLNAHESAKAYQCAKIVLNTNLEPPVNGVNGKTFEICAAGGFQITDFRQDLPELFVPEREVVVFSGISDLKEKISRYLSDTSARAAIARAGQERCLRDHTMRVRVRTMIAAIS